MEKVVLSEEQIKMLSELAKQFVEVFKEMWEKLKEFANKIAPLFQGKAQSLEEYFKREQQKERKYLFGNITHTKGRIFKSQVQLNKPKFIKARSHL